MRKQNRLKNYDYSQNGGYFITVCTHEKKHILAVIYNEPYGTGNPSPAISSAIAWFKYQTTKEINLLRKSPGARVWQRSFHDHIVRGQQDYEEIWQYIDENPLRWDSDCYY